MGLVGCIGLQSAVAEDDTRTLSFEHTHRDDSLTITFKRNGRYDQDALNKLNYFLRDWRNDKQTQMDPRLFDILWEINHEVGATQPIRIISSYRSPETNAMLHRRSSGVAKHSQHMLGHAIDFTINGVPLEKLRFAGLRLQRGGVGYYPSSNFVHVDVGGIRHWPRMTHDQLVRVFPDGKTVHVPTDGRPLKGYAAALAEIERRGNAPSATSLAAARGAGIQTADAESAGSGRGRNFLAKLLGINREEDEESESVPARGRNKPAATPPAQEVAAVPLPRSRPARADAMLADAGPAPAAEFSLASESSRPAPTPSDVVNSRGFWQEPTASPPASQSTAATPPLTREAVLATGERLAWVAGPDGQLAPPRPPRDIEAPVAPQPEPDTTASVAAWASNPNNDRVPADVALAYAAATTTEPALRPASAPMGALKPANTLNTGTATIATKRPAINSPAAKIGQRNFDPWLRGVVMTPSVHHSLSVATVGVADARTLRPLLLKPQSMVAMVFSNDPTLGLTSLHFTGTAIAFLPTIDLSASRTARLRLN